MYRLYCDHYAKFEDQAFDNFHFIGTLTSATYPMNWFSPEMVERMLNILFFHLLGANILFTILLLV